MFDRIKRVARRLAGPALRSGRLAAVGLALSAAAGTAVAGNLGINVGGALDFEPTRFFADAMKSMREWKKAASDANANIDANGWPTEDAKVVVWHGLSRSNGTYALSFNGQATVTAGFGSVSMGALTYNSGTNTTSGTLAYNSTDGAGLQLTFTNTKRTGTSATNTGITNVKLMRPVSQGSTTTHGTGEQFHRSLTGGISIFSTIRTMDFTATNGNQQTTWSGRTRPTHASQNVGNPSGPASAGWQGRGAAWEYTVALANATDKDLWICVPHMADADYMTKLAQLMRYGSDGNNPYTSAQTSPVWPGLESGRKLYVEYSNEVWNWGFEQAQWNNNNRGGDTYIIAHARRVATMAQRFRTVWGSSFGKDKQCQVVLCWQIGWNPPDYQYEDQMAFINSNFETPSNLVQAISGAPYFNASDNGDSGTVSQILDKCQTDINSKPAGQFNPVKAVANKWGVKFWSYEGGPHLYGSTNLANKIAANNDSRMRTLSVDYLDKWWAAGGDLFCWFTIASGYDQNGMFGLSDEIYVQNTPKWLAMHDRKPSGTTPPPPPPPSTPPPPPPASGGTLADGTYQLKARHSGKALDLNAGNQTNGTQLHQWTADVNNNNQKWRVTKQSDGYYEIALAGNTAKVVDASGGGTANGTRVQIWDDGNANAQRWAITATDGGFYKITSKNSSTAAIDVSGVSTADGALIHLWTYGGANNQQWSFTTVSGTTPPPPPPPPSSGTALSRTGWAASASHNNATAGNLINGSVGDTSSTWNSGASQVSGMWVQVNMGSARTFNRIAMKCGTNDHPRNFKVQVSDNGSTWTDVTTGTGSGADVSVTFTAQTRQYFRITLTGGVGNWWSMSDVAAYN